jgi:hypothetical protein
MVVDVDSRINKKLLETLRLENNRKLCLRNDGTLSFYLSNYVEGNRGGLTMVDYVHQKRCSFF